MASNSRMNIPAVLESDDVVSSTIPDEDIYPVEKIVNHRRMDGKLEFLIKWEGFPDEYNTWELESKLFCHDLISKYKKKNKTEIEKV
ncbi:chromobox protein homolog 5-like isoform X2 [Sipha flava]|uniref:Chromobox protein homolog 5-like isoform X2 n=1 Tax=Sipha flava TaxID=143950 RepID=A0A8B8GEG7_9HEMI|nr:chromobox protein homolog 5-like isoform X2 [Sipha flava]XP_025421051.1 chromobox protein homolog 5-like isoform X2 [Sipha flava]XP_025421052.1 chromobox protein homolog 5-like isoform X2 [Sipha flava]